MEIKLDAEAASSIAAAAIFDSLSQDARDSVIKQAVQHLLTPTKDSRPGYYGSGKTPLQTAFDQALTNAAYKAVEEKVKNDPEIHAHIQELLGPLLNKTLEAEAEHFDTSLADKLGGALAQWLAEMAQNARRN